MFKLEGEICPIPVEWIHPHPDNPRKDLGDLTELTESVKQNGVLQNLTVVAGHYLTENEWIDVCKANGVNKADAKNSYDPKGSWNKTGYTVIIGHRRLAAAKLAGLDEVPCVVVEMTSAGQLRTMLMENMQRVDLTPYEQAKGFQMMMDLGSSVKDIAKDTGFSEATVRQRIKWAEFDEKTFEKAASRQISITDLNKVSAIKDERLRNKALASLGTNNFDSVYSSAKREDNFITSKTKWIEIAETFATRIEKFDNSTMQFKCSLTIWQPDKKLEVPEDADTRKYFYKVSDNSVDIYGEKKREKTADELEETAAREAVREMAEKLEEEFTELSKQYFERRMNFIKSLSPQKADLPKVLHAAAELIMFANAYNKDHSRYWDWKFGASLIGLELLKSEEKHSLAIERISWEAFREIMTKEPELKCLCLAYASVENSKLSYFDRDWKLGFGCYAFIHRNNTALTKLYQVLESLGYEMTDEEKQLQDGTYPAFEELEG